MVFSLLSLMMRLQFGRVSVEKERCGVYTFFLISGDLARVGLLRSVVKEPRYRANVRLRYTTQINRTAEQIVRADPSVLLLDASSVSARQQSLLFVRTEGEVKRVLLLNPDGREECAGAGEREVDRICPSPADRIEAGFLFDDLLVRLADEKKLERDRRDMVAEEFSYYTDEELAAAAVRIIEQNYRQGLTEQILADRLFVSRTRLANVFKREIGIAPHEYLKRVRLWEASVLLVNSTKQIKEIASDVGYKRSGYFAECFRDVYRQSPTDFRKMPVLRPRP